MNSKNVGDSYDLVKRALLQWLGGNRAAHPMLTERMTSKDSANRVGDTHRQTYLCGA